MPPPSPLLSPRLARASILTLVSILAFLIRLYTVTRFDSVVQEAAPHASLRATKLLAAQGFASFRNWFDDRTWYPLGRFVGATASPGLMVVAAAVYHSLHALSLPVNIRYVCVFLPPCMAACTAILTYLLTKEVVRGGVVGRGAVRGEGAGLCAAAFVAIAPGLLSRTTAGSFHTEAVAVCALVATCYAWARAINTGSMFASVSCALCFLALSASWPGYVFLLNLLPLHALLLLASGLYSHRLYVAYSTCFSVGLLLIAPLPSQPLTSPQHVLALAVFVILQARGGVAVLRGHLSSPIAVRLARTLPLAGAGVCVLALLAATTAGYGWSEALYSLLDPLSASGHLAVHASVSDDKPTSWAALFFDFHLILLLLPLGLWRCALHPSDAALFLCCYALSALYCAGVSVRAAPVLAPAASALAGIALSQLLTRHIGSAPFLDQPPTSPPPLTPGKAKKAAVRAEEDTKSQLIAAVTIGLTLVLVCAYALHANWVSGHLYAYSTIALSSRLPDGSRHVIDDFRQAYAWLRHNTPADAKVLSWWDYGHHIASLANRTVIVDGDAWNSTHMATVGRAFASEERDAVSILSSLDVQYVMVVFGGAAGYGDDDINKFVWMLRVGGLPETDYYTPSGELAVGKHATPAFTQTLLYKMCYHRFAELHTHRVHGTGYDLARNSVVDKNVTLAHFEEVLTTENWLVRVYRLRPAAALQP